MAISKITENGLTITDLTVADDLTVTDDLLLASDGAILKFGADADVTLTHVHNTGLTLNDALTTNDNITISAGNPVLSLAATGDGGEGSIHFKDDDGNSDGKIAYRTDYASNVDNYMSFSVSGTEHIRVGSAGCLMLGFNESGRTSPAYANRAFEAYSSTDNVYPCAIHNKSSGSLPYGLFIVYDQSPDNHNANFIGCTDGTAGRFVVANDGDVTNHDNSYGAISDERIKQDIVDANSQWDDIKNIKVRNFKKKDDVAQYGEKAWSQIGVVAQELETVSPKLIRESIPTASDIKHSAEFGTLYEKEDTIPEGKEVGDVKEIKANVKQVSYSVLYMKAVKALQEAMTRIETLEAKVKALEEA